MKFITVLTPAGGYEKDINLSYVKSFYRYSDKTILDMGGEGYYYSTMSVEEIRKLIKEQHDS